VSQLAACLEKFVGAGSPSYEKLRTLHGFRVSPEGREELLGKVRRGWKEAPPKNYDLLIHRFKPRGADSFFAAPWHPPDAGFSVLFFYFSVIKL
jgi:hypothetical protein